MVLLSAANNQLRAAIEFLKEGYNSENFWLWNQRLGAAIVLKTELQGCGYTWQVRRIENFIHLYKRKMKAVSENKLFTASAEADSERAEEASF